MYEKQEQGKRKRQKTQDDSKHSRNERWFDCNVIITTIVLIQLVLLIIIIIICVVLG